MGSKIFYNLRKVRFLLVLSSVFFALIAGNFCLASIIFILIDLDSNLFYWQISQNWGCFTKRWFHNLYLAMTWQFCLNENNRLITVFKLEFYYKLKNVFYINPNIIINNVERTKVQENLFYWTIIINIFERTKVQETPFYKTIINKASESIKTMFAQLLYC